jgi:hypothetical protein
MLAYITGTVDQELLLRNEYLAAENRILRAKIKDRLLLSDSEKATLESERYSRTYGADDVSSTGEAKADFSKTDKPMPRAG